MAGTDRLEAVVDVRLGLSCDLLAFLPIYVSTGRRTRSGKQHRRGSREGGQRARRREPRAAISHSNLIAVSCDLARNRDRCRPFSTATQCPRVIPSSTWPMSYMYSYAYVYAASPVVAKAAVSQLHPNPWSSSNLPRVRSTFIGLPDVWNHPLRYAAGFSYLSGQCARPSIR